MIWTVVYMPSAEKELTNIWVAGPDRKEISRAADLIEGILRKDPIDEGDEYNVDLILVIEPLAVVYQVSPDDCLVSVVQVRRTSE